jgi:multiple antibiotic resistance protein
MVGLGSDTWDAFRLLWHATNPVAMTLIFCSLVGYHCEEARRQMIHSGSAIAFFFVLVFAFWGQSILNFLEVNMSAIEFVSGFALASVAIDTLRVTEGDEKISKRNFSVIPLAMPIFGSPGTLTCAMNLVAQATSTAQRLSFIAAWACVISLAWGLLLLFSRLIRAAGEVATVLLFRLAGLLILALGMQYAFSGIVQTWHGTP